MNDYGRVIVDGLTTLACILVVCALAYLVGE